GLDPAADGAALPLLAARRDARHRAGARGPRAADREPRRQHLRLRRRDARDGDAARSRAAAGGARYGGVLPADDPVLLDLHAPHGVGGGDAGERGAAPRAGGVPDGVPGGRARLREAVQPALSAAALRARLHAPRPRDRHADRPGRNRRLRGAVARAGPLPLARPPDRRAGGADHRDDAVAGAARHAAPARQVPHPFRRAAALRGRPERRGRRDRAQGGGGEGRDPQPDRRRAGGAPGLVRVSAGDGGAPQRARGHAHADHAHAGHAHGGAEAARGRDRRALAVALAITLSFLVVEVVGGLLSGSLALLADAGHMATDAAGLALALLAARLAGRRPT